MQIRIFTRVELAASRGSPLRGNLCNIKQSRLTLDTSTFVFLKFLSQLQLYK